MSLVQNCQWGQGGSNEVKGNREGGTAGLLWGCGTHWGPPQCLCRSWCSSNLIQSSPETCTFPLKSLFKRRVILLCPPYSRKIKLRQRVRVRALPCHQWTRKVGELPGRYLPASSFHCWVFRQADLGLPVCWGLSALSGDIRWACAQSIRMWC